MGGGWLTHVVILLTFALWLQVGESDERVASRHALHGIVARVLPSAVGKAR